MVARDGALLALGMAHAHHLGEQLLWFVLVFLELHPLKGSCFVTPCVGLSRSPAQGGLGCGEATSNINQAQRGHCSLALSPGQHRGIPWLQPMSVLTRGDRSEPASLTLCLPRELYGSHRSPRWALYSPVKEQTVLGGVMCTWAAQRCRWPAPCSRMSSGSCSLPARETLGLAGGRGGALLGKLGVMGAIPPLVLSS